MAHLAGAAGSAWNVMPDDPAWDTCVRLFYVKLDTYHPMLKWFVIAVSHLRDVPGAKPPMREAPDKSHEFLLGVIDPEDFLFEDFDPDNPKSFKFLPPLIVYYQQNRLSDSHAIQVADRLAQDMVDGVLVPDEYTRNAWVNAINDYSRWAKTHV